MHVLDLVLEVAVRQSLVILKLSRRSAFSGTGSATMFVAKRRDVVT